ncbi:hypothetical protein OSI08_27060, partial [Mycobacterium ulcerans]
MNPLLQDDIPVVRLVEDTTSNIDTVENITALPAEDPDTIDDILHQELTRAVGLNQGKAMVVRLWKNWDRGRRGEEAKRETYRVAPADLSALEAG